MSSNIILIDNRSNDNTDEFINQLVYKLSSDENMRLFVNGKTLFDKNNRNVEVSVSDCCLQITLTDDKYIYDKRIYCIRCESIYEFDVTYD